MKILALIAGAIIFTCIIMNALDVDLIVVLATLMVHALLACMRGCTHLIKYAIIVLIIAYTALQLAAHYVREAIILIV